MQKGLVQKVPVYYYKPFKKIFISCHNPFNKVICSEFKHEVYRIAEQIAGPLVQRVNRQVFVHPK
jgi:hypothetical protein